MTRRGFVVTEDRHEGIRRVPVVSSIIAGRANDCDIALADAAASRHHVEFSVKDSQFYWKDLGSTNGTLINGSEMREGILHDGDRIQIGETVLRFEIEEVPTPAASDEASFFRAMIDAEGREVEADPSDTHAEGLLRTVYAVVNRIASNYDVCSLVDEILETTGNALDARRGALLFATPEEDATLPCLACGNYHIIDNGRLRHVSREAMHISSNVIHRVLSRGETVLYHDTDADGKTRAAESVVQQNLRSIMCAPLRAKYGIVGLLCLDTDRPERAYTREDMLLFTAVGNSAGLAIENARMHNEMIDKERADQEIRHAWSIQEGFLVKHWPDDPRVQVYGETRPAKVVGGDFYDVIQLDADRLALLIGDVSGKGVPAALTMAQILAEFRFRARSGADPAEVLTQINRQMHRRSQFGMFCTMCYVTIDVADGTLRFANAGHHPILCITPAGFREFGAAGGPPIGVLEDTVWQTEEDRIAPDEVMLLYSDGIVEARGMHTRRDSSHVSSDEFGVKNLARVAQGFYREPPRVMVNGINLSVQEYTAPAMPHDDCTLLVIKYAGSARPGPPSAD